MTGRSPARAVDPDAFRAVSRHWTTGVALLTVRADEELFAKTVSSLCTLSLDPPLVSVAVDLRSPLVAAARVAGHYAVSVLTDRQHGLARRFAAPGAGRALGLFTGAPMRTEDTGAPVLEGCLAWFDCLLHDVLPGGDHALLIGRVVAAEGQPGEPLVHHDGRFHSLELDLELDVGPGPVPDSAPGPPGPASGAAPAPDSDPVHRPTAPAGAR
ncbi:flavin reductase family protein [Streptacidiphilus cavernicola]|uniref:Flavin reductase family protein n=1 Tax=Streptacidiphilus cavernicola TaxID=3342716 RepID=A0ABV6VP70_9ACTN